MPTPVVKHQLYHHDTQCRQETLACGLSYTVLKFDVDGRTMYSVLDRLDSSNRSVGVTYSNRQHCHVADVSNTKYFAQRRNRRIGDFAPWLFTRDAHDWHRRSISALERRVGSRRGHSRLRQQ